MLGVLEISNYLFNPYAVPVFVSGMFVLLVGARIFFINDRSLENITFTIFCLSVSFWLLGLSFSYSSVSKEVATFWNDYVVLFGVTLIPSTITFFIIVYNRLFPRYKVFIFLSFLFGLFFYYAGLHIDSFHIEMKETYFGWYHFYSGWLCYLFLLYFVITCSFAVCVFGKYVVFLAKTVKREQGKIVFTAMLIAFLSALDFFTSFGFDYYPFGYFPILMFVTIVYFSFFNPKIVPFKPSLEADMIMQTLIDMIIVVGKNGKIKFMNKPALKLLKYKLVEVEDLEFYHLFQDSKLTFESLLSENVFNQTLIAKDNEVISCNIITSLIKTAKGELNGVILVAKDIRAIEKQIADLKKKNDNLIKAKVELNNKVMELEKFETITSGRQMRLDDLRKEVMLLKKEKGVK